MTPDRSGVHNAHNVPIINLANLKTYKFVPHGGEGEVEMKFSFEELKGTGGWNFLAYVEFPVGVSAGDHHHVGNDEWFFVLDGEATITIDGKKFRVKKGDCILTRSGSWHSITEVTTRLKMVAVEVKSL